MTRDAGRDASEPDEDGGTGETNKTRVTSVVPEYTVAGEPYKYEGKTNEPGQAEWEVKSGPDGMSSDGTTIAWEPTKSQAGEHEVKVQATINDKAVEQTATVTVATSEKRAETKSAASEGGTAVVTAPNSKIQGASISVSKGATNSDQPITISELDSSPKMAGKSGEAPAVQFGPSGTVFAKPALVALPLPNDVVIDVNRLGAFVHDGGRWERVSVVRADLENRVLYAHALHFSPYMAAVSALGLELELYRGDVDSDCEGRLFSRAWLTESLSEVDSAAINNPSESLKAMIEGGVGDLDSVMLADGLTGSLRFVRVVDLIQGSGEERRVIDQRVHAATLFLPGDGSATVTHTDALGNLLGRFEFGSVAEDIGTIGEHLRGLATRQRFAVDPGGELAIAGRFYIVHYEGDASFDPANPAELGGVAVDQDATDPGEPEISSAAEDLDCDRLAVPFDLEDNRFATAIYGEPEDVVSTVVGATVTLRAWLENAADGVSIAWDLLGGDAFLGDGDNQTERTFTANVPGLYQVEARATVEGESYSYFFFIQVAPPRTLPSCTPAASASTLTLGESAELSAVLGESSVARDALTVQWGVMRDSLFQDAVELAADGDHATYTPAGEGTHVVACRVFDGTNSGAVGTSDLAVLPAGTNRLPVDLSVAPWSATLLVDESVTLSAVGADPDGDSLQFAWTADGGTLGTPSGTELSSAVTFSSHNPGLFAVQVSIEDGGHIPQVLTVSILVLQSTSDLSGADADADGWPAGVDCNDNAAAINPTAVDHCGDEVDDDCSGGPRTSDCDGDGQSSEDGDCDDQNAAVNGAAIERCDGVDNDCDEAIDDGYGTGAECSVGSGACTHSGRTVCAPDGASALCDAQAGLPAPEVCDGSDNDCDGATDEDYVSTPTSCGVGECVAAGQWNCVEGQEVDTCKPGKSAQVDSLCDGRDEDCDGETDEDFASQATQCGTGACAATGATSCAGGQVQDSCQQGAPATGDASCDGVDNDCDGDVDEDYAATPTTCGIGACAATGTLGCVDGGTVDSCQAGTAAESDADCDNVDDDCSGQADEDYAPHETSCGTGACVASGTSSCAGGVELDNCTAGAPASSDANCDGVDDDCSGENDEDYVTTPTGCGTGACQAAGTRSCQNGSEVDSCTAGTPAQNDSDCNDVDDDCNGQTDEDYVPAPTLCGTGVCQASGMRTCQGGNEVDSCVAGTGTQNDSDCNGLDDDCSGEIDEDYAPAPTSCGTGACQASGMRTCQNGSEVDSCTAGAPAPSDADCDGVDDDCNGDNDEDYVAPATTCGVGACVAGGLMLCQNGQTSDTCVAGTPAGSDPTCDGVDDDCNGQNDEDYLASETSCGIGACGASGVRTCVNGAEQDSCAPSSPIGSDTSCDGVDQDCDGDVDDDFVSLLEVCNGRDDDCNGEIDEVPCSGQGGACEEQGPEICSGMDEDCDGLVDEDNVCGLTLVEGTLPGVWWQCTDDTCDTMSDGGFMFGNDGLFLMLKSFDHETYDPAEGPYCADGAASWAIDDGTVSIDWVEGGEPRHAEGTVSFAGLLATIDWTITPDPEMTVTFFKRVPEQAGGLCPNDGPNCESFEDCQNGFDDDCDGMTDFGDPDCQCQGGEVGPEICDGIDNNCDGSIDNLSGNCEAPGQGVCQFGHRVCDVEGNIQCVAGEPDPAGEVCPDGLDNDCDGDVDEAGCIELSAGETCMNPIDVSAGGVFHTQLGQRDDVGALCSPPEFNDRVFVFSVPPGPGFEYFIRIGNQDQAAGGSLIALPAGWEPGMGCPGTGPGEGICMGGSASTGGFKQYLSGGTSYMIVVDSFPGFGGEPPLVGELTLSIAHHFDGQCSPDDDDEDGTSICDMDCDDSDGSVHPDAEELCNGRDDDCDGQADEQEGTCATSLTGVCALGVPTCDGGGACQPIQPGSPVDYCNDEADNDCNGAVDDDCVDMPGEACTNAVDLGLGGTYFGTLDTANDDAVSRCGSAPEGRERFFRFTVPAFTNVIFQAQERQGVRYVIYRDCSLEPVTCFLPDGESRNVEPGTYLLAVEQEETGPGAPADFRFTVGLVQEAGCLTPDFDEDGFTVCDDDCDESNPAIHPEASEGGTCDQVDNDCDGQVDDIEVPCVVPGQQGVCADGALSCTGEGTQCNQINDPDPQGRDYCGDGLDNDCDGAADDADPDLCVELLAGDVCTLPENVGPGGVFTGSFEGYGDDDNLGCGDGQPGGPGAVERFYAITVSGPRRLQAFVRLPGSGGGTEIPGDGKDGPSGGGIQVAVLSRCGDFANSCNGSFVDTQLLAGTYLIAVTGQPTMQYELYVMTSDIGDFEGVTCSPPDSDDDGFNLCNGDCNEANPTVHTGASEDCDGVDNDCDFFVDDGFFGGEFCSVEGAQGECAVGHTACIGGGMGCQAERNPGDFPEVCSNETDEDCDGPADDNGVPGEDCLAANGESCVAALPLSQGVYITDSLEGATDDGQGCYGGVNGDAEEKYYGFDSPFFGTAFVHAKPLGSGFVPEHAVGVFGASCNAQNDLGCRGPGYGSFTVAPGPHHVVIESDQPFAYELQVAVRDGETGNCTVADQDGDGFTLCNGDCDDSESTRFFGAFEVCDGIDNDCDGGVDNLGGPSCETGIPGICAIGSVECSGGEAVCVPDRTALPDDICSDSVDNDCDGETDEPECQELPAGETCELAIDVSDGGAFPGTLLGRTDENQHCNPVGSADTYFTFTVGQNGANVYFELVPTFDPGGPEPLNLQAHLFVGCDQQQGFGCFQRFTGGFLGAGEYKLAIEANRAADFALFIAFDNGLGCEAGEGNGDFDNDGTTLCNNDCDELDPSVHPGAPEVCNNFRDDDCDGNQDSLTFSPCESAEPGECAAGRLECPAIGPSPVCMPIIQPGSRPELCADGLDNDCNEGTDEPACVPATGDTCELAINLDLASGGETSGTITDTADDAPGCSSQFFGEKVYRVTAPVTGFMFAQATAAAGFTGEFRVRNSDGNCFGPSQCDAVGSAGARPVEPGHVYFLAVDGPPETPFVLRWALRPGESQFFGPCFDGMSDAGNGDFDGDFSSMCGEDCNESDPNAFMGASEICGNNQDDSCNGMIDEEGFSCDTDLFGVCAFGHTFCEVSGEPTSCIPDNEPGTEFCNGFDDDCDGEIDDGTCLP